MTEIATVPGGVAQATGKVGMPGVSIVIPAHDRPGLTSRCIEAIHADRTAVPYEVIVVDDGSGAEFNIEAPQGATVSVIRRHERGGFARACNDGAAAAQSDMLLFLNNDTLPRAGWLSALMEHAEENPQAAIVGAKLLYPNGTVQHAGVTFGQDRLPRHLYQGFPADHPAVNRSRSFKAVTAACMLVRRDAFELVGGFDTAYHNCLEDVDLCLRVSELRHRIDYCPSAEVVHYESVTRGRRSADIDAAARTFRARWAERIVPDDLAYYLDDDLLQISYDATFPVRMRIAPELAVLDGARSESVEALLDVTTRRVFELLSETIRLTVDAIDLPSVAREQAAPSTPTELLERAAAVEAEIAAIQQTLHDSGGRPPSQQLAYRASRERLRAAVLSVTAPGAVVLVVSRGDDRLVDLQERFGRHFPQDPSGGYAGYHPANDTEAVDHLEKLRADGAAYLVLPEVSWWWLEHYPGLTAYLQRTARLTLRNRDCQIYAL